MANSLTINKLLSVLTIGRRSHEADVKRGAQRASLTILALGLLAGCVAPQAPKPEAAAPVVIAPAPRPTALTTEAEAALKAAEQSLADARAKKSVWSAAVEHMKQARAAAKVFDSGATTEHANEVVALCTLSIQQTLLPPVKW